ncbi:MAG TPA: hypothetical protein VFH54_11835 [Mycobacteriales bacterium]|nr:hypothetical protein [Mycobacteriales bacterium]
MSIEQLAPLVGEWEMSVDIPGADHLRGRVVFEWMSGNQLLIERTEIPDPNVPDGLCVVAAKDDGTFVQHYFDSRGVVRVYDMTFDGQTWTLLRTKEDFTPLHFQQRYTGRISDDGHVIEGVWEASDDGVEWRRDFGLAYRRQR